MRCEEFTKPAQSSGPENIGLQRPLPALLALAPVLSPSRITLENNGKIWPEPDGENAFAGASGGGNDSLRNSAVLASRIESRRHENP